MVSIKPPSSIMRSSSHLTTPPPLWISLWFAISSLVVLWDAGYCLMRPRSLPGGDLHWIWKPYALYGTIDLVYSAKKAYEPYGFTSAQALMNVIECILNFEYLYLAHTSARISKVSGAKTDYTHPTAPLVGFAAAVMTLSKTALYWLQEYFCDYCEVGHNSLKDLFWLWIIPNGLWLVIPLLIVNSLGSTIGQALRCHARDVIEESERFGEGEVEDEGKYFASTSTSNGTDLVARLEPLDDFLESERHEEVIAANQEEEEQEEEQEDDEDDEQEQEQIVFKSSPRKTAAAASRTMDVVQIEIQPETPVKRGRGRPRKSEAAAPSSTVKSSRSIPGTPSSFISESSGTTTTRSAASPTMTRAARATRRQTRSAFQDI